jgi:hypothetical protein
MLCTKRPAADFQPLRIQTAPPARAFFTDLKLLPNKEFQIDQAGTKTVREKHHYGCLGSGFGKTEARETLPLRASDMFTW